MLVSPHRIPYVRKFNLLSYAKKYKIAEQANSSCKNKMKQKKLNFNIKLLSGKAVVLIECDGYESEVFVPFISTEGRISIQNIIPNRRCCNLQEKEDRPNASRNNKRNSKLPKCDKPLQTTTLKEYLDWRRKWANKENNKPAYLDTGVRLCGGDGNLLTSPTTPLANSTPTKKARVVDKSVYDTPEQVRRVMKPTLNAIELPNPEITYKTIYTSPTLRHIRERTLTAEQLRKISRLKKPRINNTQETTATDDYSIILPQSPTMPSPDAANLNASPTLPPPNTPKSKSQIDIAAESRWHKVRTPMYTYSRTKIFSGKKKIPTPLTKPVKIKSSYLANPTQCPKPLHKLEVKKRKIILDAKLVISPKSFKNQQEKEESLKPQAKKVIPIKSRQTAFDLLTNSSRSHQISPKLNGLFRLGCVNKATATNPRYKVLATVPPLENDMQVQLLEQQRQQAPI